VTADRQIRLIGFQVDQILSVLEEQTAGRPGWAPIRDRIAAGDRDLIALFRSPMRLATALQSYRDRDAEELGTLKAATAQGQLWEQLLTLGSPEFRGSDHERIRSWLHFLASGMQRRGRQRFWLHELYLFAPERPEEFRRFRVQLGLTVRLAVALVFGLVAGMRFGLAFGLAVGLAGGVAGQLAALLTAALPLTSRLKRSRLAWPDARSVASGFVATLAMLSPTLATAFQFVRSFGTTGLTTWLVAGFVALSPGLVVAFIPDLFAGLATGRFVREAPSVKVSVPWKMRAQALRKGFAAALASGLAFGLVLALVAGLAAQARVGLAFGLAGTLAAALVAGLGSLLGAGTVRLSSDPPRRLAGRGTSAALGASRNAGLVTGVTLGLLYGTIVALAFGFLFGPGAGLAFGLAYGLSAALVLGLAGGVAPWLYYHWLRLRLARRGLLPRRLREFLDWCASQNRGWMRASDAYEFRHPTLLERLASTPSPQRLPTEEA
jgi:hypothetical protein